MASTTTFLMQEKGPPIPAQGSYPMAANTLIPGGTLVTIDSSGNANSPATNDASGNPAVGIAKLTYNNKTGSPAGGSAGDLTCEVVYGVGGFAISGTTPKARDRVYVVDNQTVSIDQNGTRGFAGVVIEVRTINGVAQAFVFVGPIAPGDSHKVGTLPAFAAGDTAPTAIQHNAHYDIPTTAANSTISLPAATSYPDGLTAFFHADGTKNGHTLTFRDVATAISAATTASKRVLAIASVMGGKWTVTLTVGP